MKHAIATLLAASFSTLLAANVVPVFLDPDAESPQVGELEALSLAVPAEWPSNVVPVDNWQPVYLHGVFEVYVDNNDVSKELAAKPGRPYYLSPETDATVLAIATDKDKADILSVDSWFTKMQLETIVRGYIQSSSVEASAIIRNLPRQTPASTAAASEAMSTSELVGRLEKTGLIGRNRTGLAYKLIGIEGSTLAFIDVSNLPNRIQVDDFLDLEVRVSGVLSQEEGNDDVRLKAKSIKKAF